MSPEINGPEIAEDEHDISKHHNSHNPFVTSLTMGVAAAVDALTEFKQREKALARSAPRSRARL